MTDLSTLAPDFVDAAHSLVYCSVEHRRPRRPSALARDAPDLGVGRQPAHRLARHHPQPQAGDLPSGPTSAAPTWTGGPSRSWRTATSSRSPTTPAGPGSWESSGPRRRPWASTRRRSGSPAGTHPPHRASSWPGWTRGACRSAGWRRGRVELRTWRAAGSREGGGRVCRWDARDIRPPPHWTCREAAVVWFTPHVTATTQKDSSIVLRFLAAPMDITYGGTVHGGGCWSGSTRPATPARPAGARTTASPSTSATSGSPGPSRSASWSRWRPGWCTPGGRACTSSSRCRRPIRRRGSTPRPRAASRCSSPSTATAARAGPDVDTADPEDGRAAGGRAAQRAGAGRHRGGDEGAGLHLRRHRRCERTLRFLAAPSDVNWGGKVHGGTVMRWIDEAALRVRRRLEPGLRHRRLLRRGAVLPAAADRLRRRGARRGWCTPGGRACTSRCTSAPATRRRTSCSSPRTA